LPAIGVGMIGLGGISTRAHLPGYMEIPGKAKIVALCDVNRKSFEPFAEVYGAKEYSDYHDLLADPDVQVVDICLPHFLHGEVAFAAAKAKKHVLVEKPIATNLDQASNVIQAAKENKVKLMVAENTRFVEAYRITKRLIDDQRLGKICLARTIIAGSEIKNLSNPKNWSGKKAMAGGGVIFDAGVHSFYLLEWLVGRIKSIYAASIRSLPDLPSDIEDNATGLVRFESGAVANFSLSDTAEIPWTERLELYGTQGGLMVDMLSERPVQVFSIAKRSNDQNKWWGRYGDVSWEEPFFQHSAMDWKFTSIKKEVQHFITCVAENVDPLVTGEDGRRAIEIALKAYESAETGREVQT
jgi:UDP-N-acetyl-2-amino-2-deoxyglucuronate dehydrogenase